MQTADLYGDGVDECLLFAKGGDEHPLQILIFALEDDEYVRLALLMVLLVVFMLPRMHERYFYLATPLSIALAARRPGKAVLAAALIELALLATYWALAINLSLASGMMLAALVLILIDCDK